MFKFIKQIGIIRFHIKKLNQFDDITKFRIFMGGLFNIHFAMIIPILGQLYGLTLDIPTLGITAATVLAFFSILRTVAMKYSPILMKKTSFSNIFKINVILFIFYALSAPLYFINPTLMVWCESLFNVLDLMAVTAYSMSLNNYITYFHNETYSKFIEYRNDMQTESWLVGSLLSMFINYFFGIEVAIVIATLISLIIIYYNFKNWNLMKPHDFKYMLRYMKHTKK